MSVAPPPLAGQAGGLPPITGGSSSASASNYAPTEFGSTYVNNSSGGAFWLFLGAVIVAGFYAWKKK